MPEELLLLLNRNNPSSKAEYLEPLSLSEELAINGIMLINDRISEQRFFFLLTALKTCLTKALLSNYSSSSSMKNARKQDTHLKS